MTLKFLFLTFPVEPPPIQADVSSCSSTNKFDLIRLANFLCSSPTSSVIFPNIYSLGGFLLHTVELWNPSPCSWLKYRIAGSRFTRGYHTAKYNLRGCSFYKTFIFQASYRFTRTAKVQTWFCVATSVTWQTREQWVKKRPVTWRRSTGTSASRSILTGASPSSVCQEGSGCSVCRSLCRNTSR